MSGSACAGRQGIEEAMTKELLAVVEGREYLVVVSDQEQALLAAKAAGRAVLGLWDSRHPERAPFGAAYLIDCEEEITERYLERIVRRQMGMPWKIAETRRLLLREFASEDWRVLQEMIGEINSADIWDVCPAAFAEYPAFTAYLEQQYGFYEYGIWAVEELASGTLVGAAGIWDMEIPAAAEIGYWIRPAFCRRGYGLEAVQAVLRYGQEELSDSIHSIYAKIRKGNLPSRKLVQRLGFRLLPEDPDQGEEPVQAAHDAGTVTCHPEENGSTVLQYRFDWSFLPHPDSRE